MKNFCYLVFEFFNFWFIIFLVFLSYFEIVGNGFSLFWACLPSILVLSVGMFLHLILYFLLTVVWNLHFFSLSYFHVNLVFWAFRRWLGSHSCSDFSGRPLLSFSGSVQKHDSRSEISWPASCLVFLIPLLFLFLPCRDLIPFLGISPQGGACLEGEPFLVDF